MYCTLYDTVCTTGKIWYRIAKTQEEEEDEGEEEEEEEEEEEKED